MDKAFIQRVVETRPCIVCQGKLQPCYVVSHGSHRQECHGMEKSGLGTSVRTSAVQQFVCLGCGHVMAFVHEPQQFAADRW